MLRKTINANLLKNNCNKVFQCRKSFIYLYYKSNIEYSIAEIQF